MSLVAVENLKYLNCFEINSIFGYSIKNVDGNIILNFVDACIRNAKTQLLAGFYRLLQWMNPFLERNKFLFKISNLTKTHTISKFVRKLSIETPRAMISLAKHLNKKTKTKIVPNQCEINNFSANSNFLKLIFGSEKRNGNHRFPLNPSNLMQANKLLTFARILSCAPFHNPWIPNSVATSSVTSVAHNAFLTRAFEELLLNAFSIKFSIDSAARIRLADAATINAKQRTIIRAMLNRIELDCDLCCL